VAGRLQVDALVANEGAVQRLVYVSCGWKALQRDITDLVSSGGWRVAHAGTRTSFSPLG
jgi:tRNA/tmRNA/rRNA uracil-C5-methylase (TrmA/RlmC/RlmD family)